ncbi:dioxygenase [Alteromonas pelagimontana]|uniref:Dioxygenase n=1 Tax=Alteromonas pelagimontana TaxID=1858656 RepID=A0A6M4M888_9ALTE|nr:class III extradiol ring-cleavage dioxygenase [Alteromonas pelagimontana]QJR79441.1 dioxygenase [Alteromonas pelagimontana]
MAKASTVLYLSHGGGPLPLLEEPGDQQVVSSLKSLRASLNTPSAIILVSAHWEAPVFTITGSSNPALIYDYVGFPERAYQLEYPAAGAPDIAESIAASLASAGIKASIDQRRGYDHGMFVPLSILFPDANIPCVQISLMQSLDPLTHIQMGEALNTLEIENLLFVGSGFSFHNMTAFFDKGNVANNGKNLLFQQWLEETIMSDIIREAERKQRLLDWTNAPYARFCHPREEHLLPLHVCYGITGRPAERAIKMEILEKTSCTFLWQ